MNVEDFGALFIAQKEADLANARLESLKSKTLKTLSEGRVNSLTGDVGSIEVQLKKGKKPARTSDTLKELIQRKEEEEGRIRLKNSNKIYYLEKEIFYLEHELREILTTEETNELEEDIQRERLRIKDEGVEDAVILKIKLAEDPIFSRVDPEALKATTLLIKRMKKENPELVFTKANLRRLISDFFISEENINLPKFCERALNDKS